ncbi:MAG: response regulator, partial [Myxococcota bacterium]
TTKAAGHGTGLGLALARDILEEHGGRLHVESVLGKGSRFTLELPLARENVRVSEPARAPSTPPPASSLRMLIVDDEPLLLRAYQRTLGTHHDLTVAATGERAIGLLRAGTEFDVILCDLMMPGVDGRQVYAGALAIDESIAERIVFVSGGAFDESTARFLESIDNTVLAKPVDSAKLNKILQSVRSRRPPRESGVTLRRRALEVRAAFEPKKTRAS